jgi:prepilin-type N-terminal cleavage/methylation domain-containing protein
MSEHRCSADQAGFTLVESLVALAILVLALTAFQQSMAVAVRGWSATSAVERALAYGTAHLERIGADLPLAPASGVYDDGSLWQLSVSPSDATGSQSVAPVAQVVWVDLVVTTARGSIAGRLRTAKLTGGAK